MQITSCGHMLFLCPKIMLPLGKKNPELFLNPVLKHFILEWLLIDFCQLNVAQFY